MNSATHIKSRSVPEHSLRIVLFVCSAMLSLANSVTAQQQGPIGPPSSSGSSSTTAPAAASSAAPLHSRAEGFAESPISSEPPSIPADQIIQRFSQHESEFKKERDNYTYTQTFVFQTLDPDGVPDGEYRLTTDVSFTPEGKRYEHDTYAPVPTISRLQFTKQDLDDLRSIQPFVLTSEELPKYNVTYVGRQLIDDLHTYVFEVAPKKIEKDQRYFQGRVWVDDKDMQIVKSYYTSPIIIGIDPARKIDSTIVTAVFVDWDHQDEYGYYNCRVLNWLDLQGMDWESQYHRIVEFVSKYNVWAIGVDVGGMGDIFISRLRVLLPHVEIVDVSSQRPAQSDRWKYLREMLDRAKIGWPAHAKTRNLRTYRNFVQQMSDLQVKFEGPYMLAEAPKEVNAHDDYCDSLAIALSVIPENLNEEVEISNNPFYDRKRS